MVTHIYYSFHLPPTSHQFKQMAWFFETDIRLFTSCRTIFTWQEPTWNTNLIHTILSAIFNSVAWFFFVYSLTSNPPWKTKGIKRSLQRSLAHLQFFKRLGMLLINWHFLLLTFSKCSAPTSVHKFFYQNELLKDPSFWSQRPSSISTLVSFSLGPSQRSSIQWPTMQLKDATWEPLLQIQQLFPHLNLWGQSFF